MQLDFVGPVIEWRGPAPYFYVEVPTSVSADIREVAASFTYGWGVMRVEARIRDVTFATSLFPKDGRYLLPLKDAVRRPLALAVGDEVPVEMHLQRARS